MGGKRAEHLKDCCLVSALGGSLLLGMKNMEEFYVACGLLHFQKFRPLQSPKLEGDRTEEEERERTKEDVQVLPFSCCSLNNFL